MYIGLFRSVPAYQSHLADWLGGQELTLFLTGLSGSGKTFLSQRLAAQYHCEVISLDALRAYDKAGAFSQAAVDVFCQRHPEITICVQTQWDIKTKDFNGEKEYTKYSQMFLEELDRWAYDTHTRCIVEGIQLFVRIPKERLVNRPKLIIGTCGWKSFCQTLKWSPLRPLPHNILMLATRFCRYHIIQLIKLNCRLSAWENAEGAPFTRIDNPHKMC